MRNLVIIPFHDYKAALLSGFNTRDTHLYEHFIRNKDFDRIVIINRPTSLIELITLRKKIKTFPNSIYNLRQTYIQEIKTDIYVIDFLVYDLFSVILKKHSWIPHIYSKIDIANRIKEALDFLKIEEYSIYMSSPFSVKLGLQLNPKIRLLDAVDNFAKYKNWSYFKNEIISLYNIAKREYDYITVNSEDTFNYLSEGCNANIEMIPNGVDFEKFSQDYERPNDLPEGKLIVGYAGKMQRMFDTKLLISLAQNNPEINFVILGKFLDKKWKKKIWDKDVENHKNIIYLGFKDYNLLPRYYKHFDICFIPYIINNQHGGDPIKFYEYMACNKPIISTNIGNIKKYHNSESIIICNSNSEFKKGFDYLVRNFKNLKPNYALDEKISWSHISKQFTQKLQY